jgi:hypothetical protein
MKTVNTPAVSAINATAKALANSKPIKNVYSYSAEESAELVTWSGLSDAERKQKDKLVDLLYSGGKKPAMFVAFNESEDKQGIAFRDQTVKHLLAGRKDAQATKLYHADPKSLSTMDLAFQTVVRDLIRKDYNNLKGALQRRIDKGDKITKSAPASKTVLALRAVNQAIGYLEEVKSGYDGIVDDLKALRGLQLRLKVKDVK